MAAGLQAPTAEPLGIVAASMSPIVAHEIGQYFKANQAAGGAGEGSAPHLLAHGVLAAAVAAASAAMGAEVAAPLLAQYLYGKTPQTLSADEKTTISAITGLVGAGVGALSGSEASLVQATQSAMTAVEENYLTAKQINAWVEEIQGCETEEACVRILEKYEQLSVSQQNQLINDCATNPETCSSHYGHIISESLLVKKAIDNALKHKLPPKMVYDLTALYMNQVEAEGVVASESFAQNLQRQYGLTTDEARLVSYAAANALGAGTVKSRVKSPYEPNKGAVNNIKELFEQPGFGSLLKSNSTKTNIKTQGQSVYRADRGIGDTIRKGDLYYLDGLHKNHIEVFDPNGKPRAVLNLDGSTNWKKTTRNTGRRIK